jgi:electron transport complex protein RnfG
MDRRKSDWSMQFQGKNPKDFQIAVTKDGGDIDAITASTISSRAFCDAVVRAYTTYLNSGNNE